MRKRETFFLTFFLFLFLSLVVFGIEKTPISKGLNGVLEVAIKPLQSLTFGLFHFIEPANSDLEKIKTENSVLVQKLIDIKTIQKENSALKDQFKTTNPISISLLPVNIIGNPGFIPGVSVVEKLIIDKGEKDGIKVGQAVVSKDNIVGTIDKTTFHRSEIALVTDINSSFATTAISSNALGVIKGQGGTDMIFDNVLLSEALDVSDIVVTKGNVDSNGLGYPPNLIVGKIVSVEKKASNLFQTAKVKSLLEFQKLIVVFVITNND